MTTEQQMTSDLRTDLAFKELDRRAISDKWEHRIMQFCIVLLVLLTGLRIAGVIR
jgi:hypothetical protein